jgi:hypothetical protein
MTVLLLFWLQSAPMVAITEFHYDPSESRPGYVELRNTTELAVNLRNWRMQRRQVSNETNRFIATTDLILAPGDRLVLTADAAAMTAAFGEGPWHAMARYPTFNRTTSDEIRLFDAANRRVDSLQYTPATWIRGTAHERRSETVDAAFAENWAPGYSPGRANHARPPGTPMRISAIGIRAPHDIRIRFERRLDPARLSCADCLTANGRPLAFTTTGPDWVTARLPDGSPTEVTLSGLADLFAHPVRDTLFTIQTNPDVPTRDQLILNELQLWAPAPFIEILNVTDQAFDLAGVSVNGRALPREPLGDGFHVPIPIHPETVAVFSNLPSFNRTGGGIGLRSAEGGLLDTIRYATSTWPFASDARSLERIDPANPSNDPTNWASHPTGHSRGAGNHHRTTVSGFPNPDMTDLHAGGVRIRFPRFIMPDAESRMDVDGTSAALRPVDPMTADTWYAEASDGRELRIRHRGQWHGPWPVARIPEPGDLRFSEILYQPHQDRYSGRPDQPQFVEIHNPTPNAISLEGLHLTDAPDKHGQVIRIHPVRTDRRWIPPDAYAVIHADTAAAWTSTRLHRAFDDVPADATLRAHRSTLSLTNSGKEIRLARADGAVLDSIRYHPDMHHPRQTDRTGRSLEKIDPRLPSHIATNWTTTAHPAGGTPGRPNSVLRMPAAPRERAGIAADPNPFRDRQAIHIRADEPDYIVRLRIYDRFGRLIRTLASADPLGNGRYWWWDGLRDDGQTPGTGLYIAVAELHGSSFASNRTLRLVLVLARN